MFVKYYLALFCICASKKGITMVFFWHSWMKIVIWLHL